MVPAVNNGQLGLIVGLVLGIAGAFGGFSAFVVVLLLGAVGLLVGRYLDGQLDLSELSERSGLTGRGSDRRRG
ncbi:hypothetical protein GCM10017691_02240 [Pseudonocardia petroleophila]|uniref:Small integral membrane protein n=1 Tax=Pseudonocardia petroleophila TaxID=37331 RepID=A0A7G7ML34_9PSEU|nr:hypothetical protein [Pseudonocardia petroleophila]QNG53495.1 hypothetical protein H6H00_05870 [Pseudonocardia petroleophila]